MAIETSVIIPFSQTPTPWRFFVVAQKFGDDDSNE